LREAAIDPRVKSIKMTLYRVARDSRVVNALVNAVRNGKKVTVSKKVFPGYILVRMILDDDSWYAVRNTPGVTGFVGGSNKPTPLSRREVERFLGFQKEEDRPKPRFKPEWEVGELVRVNAGPFADFSGKIESIDLDQSKVTVLVSIFGRDTPVELGFEDIQKA